MLDNLVAIP